MGNDRRKPPVDDADLWQAVTRGVKRMPDREKPKPPPEEKTGTPRKEPVAKRAKRKAAAKPATETARPIKQAEPPVKKVDRKTGRRLKSGRVSIDRKIDLHGMSRDAAHGALLRFIPSAASDGCKNVLVVTGKGRGILRDAVPLWLHSGQLSEHIVSVSTAPQALGGDGALFVILRRGRER